MACAERLPHDHRPRPPDLKTRERVEPGVLRLKFCLHRLGLAESRRAFLPPARLVQGVGPPCPTCYSLKGIASAVGQLDAWKEGSPLRLGVVGLEIVVGQDDHGLARLAVPGNTKIVAEEDQCLLCGVASRLLGPPASRRPLQDSGPKARPLTGANRFRAAQPVSVVVAGRVGRRGRRRSQGGEARTSCCEPGAELPDEVPRPGLLFARMGQLGQQPLDLREHGLSRLGVLGADGGHLPAFEG